MRLLETKAGRVALSVGLSALAGSSAASAQSAGAPQPQAALQESPAQPASAASVSSAATTPTTPSTTATTATPTTPTTTSTTQATPIAAPPVARPTPRETIYAVSVLALPPTVRYRHFSYSLLGGATFGAGYSPAINTTVGADLATAAEFRVMVRGIVIAPSLGVKITGVQLPNAATSAALGVLAVFGVGGGYQFGLTNNLALGAVLGYRLSLLVAGGAQALHTISLDVPLTIHVGNNGIIEPFVQGGLSIGELSTMPSPGSSSRLFALYSAGARFGVTF